METISFMQGAYFMAQLRRQFEITARSALQTRSFDKDIKPEEIDPKTAAYLDAFDDSLQEIMQKQPAVKAAEEWDVEWHNAVEKRLLERLQAQDKDADDVKKVLFQSWTTAKRMAFRAE